MYKIKIHHREYIYINIKNFILTSFPPFVTKQTVNIIIRTRHTLLPVVQFPSTILKISWRGGARPFRSHLIVGSPIQAKTWPCCRDPFHGSPVYSRLVSSLPTRPLHFSQIIRIYSPWHVRVGAMRSAPCPPPPSNPITRINPPKMSLLRGEKFRGEEAIVVQRPNNKPSLCYVWINIINNRGGSLRKLYLSQKYCLSTRNLF